MIIKDNKMEDFIEFYKLYYEDMKNYISNNNLFLNIIKETNGKERKKIIDAVEEGSKDYFFIKSYLSVPFYLVLFNNEKDKNIFSWEEDIFSITKEKLINILKESGKKYLEVYVSFDGWIGSKKIFNLENI